MNTLAAQLGEHADAWRHAPGDKLIGTLTGLDRREGAYGTYPIATIRVSEPESSEEGGKPIPVGESRAFHAFRDVALSELKKVRPKLGDAIAVGYSGQPEGKSYHLYKVVGGSDTGFDWDQIDAPAEPDRDSDDTPF